MHYIVFHIPVSLFILRCAYIGVLMQLISMFLFKDFPSVAAIASLLLYLFGVFLGVFLYYLLILYNRSNLHTSYKGPVFHKVMISERNFIILALLFALPLVPDAINSLLFSLSYQAGRSLLLSGEYFLLPSKVILLLSNIIYVFIIYYFVFFSGKSKKGIAAMTVILFFKALLYLSKSEFVTIAIFYFITRKKIFSINSFFSILVLIVLLALAVIYIQGRTAERSLVHTLDVIYFYSAYFAYPLYLFDKIPDVFPNMSILYSMFGYPIDLIESYFKESETLTTHLKHIATFSFIGPDITGHTHEYANVLYPQYGFLKHSIGFLGLFLYYVIVTFILCAWASNTPRYLFFWYIVIFVIIFNATRSAAMGVPGSWFLFLNAFLLTLYLASRRGKTL